MKVLVNERALLRGGATYSLAVCRLRQPTRVSALLEGVRVNCADRHQVLVILNERVCGYAVSQG